MQEDEEPAPVKEVAAVEGGVDSTFLGLKKKKKPKKPVSSGIVNN
jgi:translation initiation factor 2 subunit 2